MIDDVRFAARRLARSAQVTAPEACDNPWRRHGVHHHAFRRRVHYPQDETNE